MELNSTLQGDRIHIAIMGRRNAGKSSVINAITGQDIAIVSGIKGTTTDPVSKAMEILPLGACLLTDTPGLDDYGELGAKRVEKTLKVLDKTDIALVVADISSLTCRDLNSRYGMSPDEEQLVSLIEEKKLPYIIVLNQTDRLDLEKTEEIHGIIAAKNPGIPVQLISTTEKTGIEELKDAIALLLPEPSAKLDITGDLVSENEIAVLVTPIDSSAPKGRLIMPQQQVIRDLLDNGAVAVVTQVAGLKGVLERLGDSVKIVITDSQAFKEVAALVPGHIPLTSFSILFARHKGNLKKLAEGAAAVDKLKDGDKVLIAEGCTHRRQCEDIGTVKIPKWLRECSGRELVIETCSGQDFPQDLSGYALIIHCGGCTLTEREMRHRILCASRQGVPIVNYGIFIAYANGILKRSIDMFPSISRIFMDNGK